MTKRETWILLIALLAAVAKIYCAWTTAGTLDVVCFREFGHIISDQGLIAMYLKTSIFNHTPLVGTVVSLMYDLTEGNDKAFGLVLRVPAILADFGSVLGLLWLRRKTGLPPWWALGLFAASPVAFMISGYHGNIDAIVTFLLLLTALACVAGEAALCGVLWGLACQIKIIPLLVAPIFLFFWWHRGQGWKFFTVASLTALAGWAWPLCTIPGVFIRNVLDYNSLWGTWGISALLRFSGLSGLSAIKMTPTGSLISEVLKIGIFATVFGLAWFRRRGSPVSLFTTLSLSWLLFFVFAPGFQVQYFAWFAPFLIVHSPRWFGILTAAATVGAFAFYTAVAGGLPWDKAYEAIKTAHLWVPWLLVSWVAMAAGLFATRKDWRLAPGAEAAESLPAPAEA